MELELGSMVEFRKRVNKSLANPGTTWILNLVEFV
jgi:hypothetical protein